MTVGLWGRWPQSGVRSVHASMEGWEREQQRGRDRSPAIIEFIDMGSRSYLSPCIWRWTSACLDGDSEASQDDNTERFLAGWHYATMGKETWMDRWKQRGAEESRYEPQCPGYILLSAHLPLSNCRFNNYLSVCFRFASRVCQNLWKHHYFLWFWQFV